MQRRDYIQLVIGVLTLTAIVVNVIVFAKRRSVDRKREAVKVGLDMEHLVVRWAMKTKCTLKEKYIRMISSGEKMK